MVLWTFIPYAFILKQQHFWLQKQNLGKGLYLTH